MFKFLGISIAAAIIVPSVAFATPTSITRSRHVSYADLDLTKASDKAMLRRRLWAATQEVCSNDESGTFSDSDVLECRQSTWLKVKKNMHAATEYALRSNAPVVLAAAR
jgi:UrcA family protein